MSKGKFMRARVTVSSQDSRLLTVRAWDTELNRYSARAFRRLLAECFEEGQDILIQPLWAEERKPPVPVSDA